MGFMGARGMDGSVTGDWVADDWVADDWVADDWVRLEGIMG
jgi:hypothetical protein